jgi:hypothetical protein
MHLNLDKEAVLDLALETALKKNTERDNRNETTTEIVIQSEEKRSLSFNYCMPTPFGDKYIF